MSLMFGRSRGFSAASAPDRGRAECNVAVLGMTGSGKSDVLKNEFLQLFDQSTVTQRYSDSQWALTVKFLTRRFISEYDPNLEDTYTSEEVVDQQPILLKIMDTADQDGPANCERYLTWASAFLVVYSIDNRRSFETCQQYLDVLSLHTKGLHPETPIILLGNKLDMERHRQVSKSDAVSLASKYGCLFFEVSACADYPPVQHVFHKAVREARRESEAGLASRPLFISEDKQVATVTPVQPLTACLRELPAPATAKLVTVKSSRAQSKRRAPTLTLLKGFKIF